MSQQYVEVELGGKARLLRYDYNAVCDIEEQLGMGVGAVFTQQQAGFRVVRVLYWAGLKWKEQGITLQRVGQMLQDEMANNGTTILDLLKPVMKALKKSKTLGEMKDVEGNEDEGNE